MGPVHGLHSGFSLSFGVKTLERHYHQKEKRWKPCLIRKIYQVLYSRFWGLVDYLHGLGRPAVHLETPLDIFHHLHTAIRALRVCR